MILVYQFCVIERRVNKRFKLFSGSQKVFLDDCKEGSTQKLLNINLFDSVNSLEIFPLSGFKLLRSAE